MNRDANHAGDVLLPTSTLTRRIAKAGGVGGRRSAQGWRVSSQKSFPRHDVFAKSPMKSISTVVRKAAVETRVIKIDRRFLKIRVSGETGEVQEAPRWI